MGPLNLTTQLPSSRIAESLLVNDALLACCDGSYSPNAKLGSHGWVFATSLHTVWRGAGPIDGHPRLVNPYRAEIGGLVNICHILLSVCKFHGISGGSMTIYCDCKSALNQLHRPNYGSIKDYLVPDYDLMNEGHSLYKQLKGLTNANLSWVKGHHNGGKLVQHPFNDRAHSLAYNFITQDQGYYNPS